MERMRGWRTGTIRMAVGKIRIGGACPILLYGLIFVTGGTIVTAEPAQASRQERPPVTVVEEIREKISKAREDFLAGDVYGPEPLPNECNGDEGEDCLPWWGHCGPVPHGCQSYEETEKLLAAAGRAAREAPSDPWVQGQAVWFAVHLRRPDIALEWAADCSVPKWWCDVLYATALFANEDRTAATDRYESAIAQMPDEEKCEWLETLPLILNDYRDYEYEIGAHGCVRRDDRYHDIFWWLADPLWLEEGNERREAHLFRFAMTLLHDDDLEQTWRVGSTLDGLGHHLRHHVGMISFGLPDSWEKHYDGTSESVSRRAAKYQFVPTVEALESPFKAKADDWDFDPKTATERYTPRHAVYVSVPHQFARFFEGSDDLIVAAATEVPFHPMWARGGRTAGMVLSPGPGEYLITYAPAHRDRYAFVDTVPRGEYVISLEVLAPGQGGVGRTRRGIGGDGYAEGTARISDIALLRLDDREEEPLASERARNDALRRVREAMLGRDWLWEGEDAEVYWEIYGLGAGESFDISIAMVPESGFFEKLKGFFGLERRNALEVSWSDAAGSRASDSQVTGDERGFNVIGRGLDLNVANFDPGAYTLRVRIRVRNEEVHVSEREVQIRSRGG